MHQCHTLHIKIPIYATQQSSTLEITSWLEASGEAMLESRGIAAALMKFAEYLEQWTVPDGFFHSNPAPFYKTARTFLTMRHDLGPKGLSLLLPPARSTSSALYVRALADHTARIYIISNLILFETMGGETILYLHQIVYIPVLFQSHSPPLYVPSGFFTL